VRDNLKNNFDVKGLLVYWSVRHELSWATLLLFLWYYDLLVMGMSTCDDIDRSD